MLQREMGAGQRELRGAEGTGWASGRDLGGREASRVTGRLGIEKVPISWLLLPMKRDFGVNKEEGRSRNS